MFGHREQISENLKDKKPRGERRVVSLSQKKMEIKFSSGLMDKPYSMRRFLFYRKQLSI